MVEVLSVVYVLVAIPVCIYLILFALNLMRRVSSLNYSSSQSPTVVNDNSIWVFLPFLGRGILGFKQGIAKHLAQVETQCQKEIFTLYHFGKYLTFVCDHQLQAHIRSAKLEQIDLPPAVTGLLGWILPDPFKQLLQRPENSLYITLTRRTFAGHRLEQIMHNIPKQYARLLSDLHGKGSEVLILDDMFSQLHRIVFYMNCLTFLSEDVATNEFCSKLYDAYQTSFEMANKKRVLWQFITRKQKDTSRQFEVFTELIKPWIQKLTQQDQNHALLRDSLLADIVESETAIETSDPLDPRVAANLFGALLAAQANTYATLAWTLLYLLKEKDNQDLYHQRIQSCIKEWHQNKNLDVLDSFTFLDDCIRESIRLGKAPWVNMRMAVSDVRLGGKYLIPKGNVIIVKSMLRQEQFVGKDPDEFYPDRYQEFEHLFKFNQKHPQLWGSGHHLCKGIKYARVLIKSILLYMFERYDMAVESAQSTELKKPFLGMMIPLNPIRLIAKQK